MEVHKERYRAFVDHGGHPRAVTRTSGLERKDGVRFPSKGLEGIASKYLFIIAAKLEKDCHTLSFKFVREKLSLP
jgi:hypothetical protein